jgi:hypothetical protein
MTHENKVSLHACKTNRHWWTEKLDAEKCCNGWVRVLLVGRDAYKSETPLVYDAGTAYGRAWMRVSTPVVSTGS